MIGLAPRLASAGVGAARVALAPTPIVRFQGSFSVRAMFNPPMKRDTWPI